MNTLKAGDKVPNFTVNDQDGNTVSLSDYKGKKIVVFFYPKASTPTCTVEACNLGENYKALQDAGYEILGFQVGANYTISGWKGFYADAAYELADNTKFEVAVGDGIYSAETDGVYTEDGGDFGLVNVAVSHTRQVCSGLEVFGQVGVNPSRDRAYATVGLKF